MNSSRAAARVAAALAVVPVLVATATAVSDGWVPVGDNANFAIRARDVLTPHHPLLGTWTSASLSIGESVNNPGPLFFDWLAIPAKIDGAAGLAIGVAMLNIASILLVAFVAYRAAGARAATIASAAAAGLSWTIGSELLFDPWQPHSMLLPFLAFVFVVWALTVGRVWMLPVGAALGTLIVQTHLSYSLLVPGLALVGCLGAAMTLRRARGVGGDEWRVARRRAGRALAVTVALLVVLWAQPLVEQLFRDGNLAALAGAAGDGPDEAVGMSRAVRFTADVVALPPWWGRPSFSDAFLPPDGEPPVAGRILNVSGLPSTGAAVAALAGLALALGVAGAGSIRRKPEAGAAAGVAAAATALTIVTIASMPVGGFGVAQHQLRPLWPVAVFATFALGFAATDAVARVAGSDRWTAPVFLAVTAVFVAAALPRHNPEVGPSADAEAIPTVRALKGELDALRGQGPVLFDVTRLRFAEPYSSPVMAEMQRIGVPFVVDDEGWVDQLGPRRRYTGEADMVVFTAEGDGAVTTPPGARRIAFVAGLDRAEQRELARLEREKPRDLSETEAARRVELRRRWDRLTVAVFARER